MTPVGSPLIQGLPSRNISNMQVSFIRDLFRTQIAPRYKFHVPCQIRCYTCCKHRIQALHCPTTTEKTSQAISGLHTIFSKAYTGSEAKGEVRRKLSWNSKASIIHLMHLQPASSASGSKSMQVGDGNNSAVAPSAPYPSTRGREAKGERLDLFPKIPLPHFGISILSHSAKPPQFQLPG